VVAARPRQFAGKDLRADDGRAGAAADGRAGAVAGVADERHPARDQVSIWSWVIESKWLRSAEHRTGEVKEKCGGPRRILDHG
jgi:hypothetical protein